MTKQLEKIISSAHAGGAMVRKYFGTELKVREKSKASDVCTIADEGSETAIIARLEKFFPSYNIFSEEQEIIDKKSKFTFYVDPLDGTNNFVLGIPYFSISIALVKDKTPIIGVVYDPILNLTYYAQRGKGAYLGKKKLKVNSETDIERATVSFATGYTTPTDLVIKFQRILKKREIKRVTTYWSPALDYCLLANGKLEGVINHNSELQDFMAGKLIAKEAGAVHTDFQGKRAGELSNNFILSNSQQIQQELVVLLKNF